MRKGFASLIIPLRTKFRPHAGTQSVLVEQDNMKLTGL